MRTLEQVTEKIWQSIEVTGFCWNWVGSKHKDGYGKVGTTRFGTRYAHRVVYTLLTGESAGPELDHLCRNRACVNPDHLEPTTHRVNSARRVANNGSTIHHFKCGHRKDTSTVIRAGRARCKECG